MALGRPDARAADRDFGRLNRALYRGRQTFVVTVRDFRCGHVVLAVDAATGEAADFGVNARARDPLNLEDHLMKIRRCRPCHAGFSKKENPAQNGGA